MFLSYSCSFSFLCHSHWGNECHKSNFLQSWNSRCSWQFHYILFLFMSDMQSEWVSCYMSSLFFLKYVWCEFSGVICLWDIIMKYQAFQCLVFVIYFSQFVKTGCATLFFYWNCMPFEWVLLQCSGFVNFIIWFW